jgi:hypothetical protein
LNDGDYESHHLEALRALGWTSCTCRALLALKVQPVPKTFAGLILACSVSMMMNLEGSIPASPLQGWGYAFHRNSIKVGTICRVAGLVPLAEQPWTSDVLRRSAAQMPSCTARDSGTDRDRYPGLASERGKSAHMVLHPPPSPRRPGRRVRAWRRAGSLASASFPSASSKRHRGAGSCSGRLIRALSPQELCHAKGPTGDSVHPAQWERPRSGSRSVAGARASGRLVAPMVRGMRLR